MRRSMLLISPLLLAGTAMADVFVDFEQPDYTLGSMHGQSGGGMTWEMFEPNSDASVAVPGFNSPQVGRWDVADRGTDSDGDDMLGHFDGFSVLTVTAQTYLHLEPNRPNGTSRAGHFFVSDADFNGSAITFLANGNVGYWGGGGFNIIDTGVPLLYDQWVPIRLDLDYNSDMVTVYYNGVQVAQDAMTSSSGDAADQVDIWLDTIALGDNPNPGDWMHIDDISIVPAPAGISLLALAGLGLRRRR